jgi:5-methylcytosine-specific restriction endonuclease McrA
MKFLPYTIQELKEHLEKQFESWMTWENHGCLDPTRDTWQIDHIIPHSSFHYETMDCEEFKKCWALENLRPLKAIDNLKKGNKILKENKER